MKFKEFFLGTPEEIAAKETINQLKDKQRLNRRDEARLRDAKLYTRRLFLRQAALFIAGGLTLVAAGGGLSFLAFEKKSKEQEHEDAYALGEKIRNWELPDGTSMRMIIPELDKAGVVFQKRSLEDLMPTVTHPVSIIYSDQVVSGPGQLILSPKFSEDKTIKIINEGSNIAPFETSLLTSLNPRIVLQKSMKGTMAELALAAKEAMQIADFLTYCRAYKSLLQSKGAKFTVIKPDNVSVSEDLVNASIAVYQDRFERRELKASMFHQLVDFGSFIRMGGIVFANWRINYPNEMALAPKDFISRGEKVAGFLLHEGVIAQRGNTFRYTRESAPQIESKEFQTLLSKASGSQFSY